MTAPLQAEYKAIDPFVFALGWFRPLDAPDAISSKRWATGMKMPYRWISVVSNPHRGFASWPVIRVHTLAATFTDAAREGNRTDARAQVLVDYPGWAPHCFFADILEAAHEEPYAAETVATRFVSEYRFGFSFVAA